MNLRFLAEAEVELSHAVAWYEHEKSGLGQKLADEVVRAIDRILAAPEASGLIATSVRCRRTRRFPCGIVYTIEGNEVVILAIMHLHRDPGYWMDRL